MPLCRGSSPASLTGAWRRVRARISLAHIMEPLSPGAEDLVSSFLCDGGDTSSNAEAVGEAGSRPEAGDSAKAAGEASSSGEAGHSDEVGHSDAGNDEPPAKRAKVDEGSVAEASSGDGVDTAALHTGTSALDNAVDACPEEEDEGKEEDLRGVIHTTTEGVPRPPPSPASGVSYAAGHELADPLPTSMVTSGCIGLRAMAGAHLDYVVELRVGEQLEGEFHDSAGKACFIKFAQVMDIHETFVPEAHRGHGAGGRLARAAFSIARSNGWSVRPSCSYISAAFLAASPKHADGASFADALLFSASPEGHTLYARRAELGKLPAKELTTRCVALQKKGAGPKGV